MPAQTPRCTRLRVVCAWCPGFVRGTETEPTSHGICPSCLARVVKAEIDDERDDDTTNDDEADRDVDDDDRDEADRCDECERSHGPHYRGPCEHGRSGLPIDFHD